MSRREQDNTRDGAGRFLPGKSGNPRGRTPEIAKVRKMLEPHREALIKKAVELAMNGDATALRLCLDKLAPAPKATAELIRVPALRDAETLTGKASAILDAVGAGMVPPDVGVSLLSALSSVARVIETDELERRIAALEELTDEEA